MRPQKYYVFFEHGTARDIVVGCAAARRLHCAWNGHRTRLEAEEFAAWWNFTHTKEYNVSDRHRPL
ncbi:hypothetical protein [Devosia sp. A449]